MDAFCSTSVMRKIDWLSARLNVGLAVTVGYVPSIGLGTPAQAGTGADMYVLETL